MRGGVTAWCPEGLCRRASCRRGSAPARQSACGVGDMDGAGRRVLHHGGRGLAAGELRQGGWFALICPTTSSLLEPFIAPSRALTWIAWRTPAGTSRTRSAGAGVDLVHALLCCMVVAHGYKAQAGDIHVRTVALAGGRWPPGLARHRILGPLLRRWRRRDCFAGSAAPRARPSATRDLAQDASEAPSPRGLPLMGTMALEGTTSSFASKLSIRRGGGPSSAGSSPPQRTFSLRRRRS